MTDSTSASSEEKSSSLMRVLNGVVLTLIGLSVLAQSLRYIQTVTNPDIGMVPPEGVLGVISLAIIPGMLLAFAKLIVYATRTFKKISALRFVAIYLLVLALPFVLSMLHSNASNRVIQTSMASHQDHPEESEQYIAGIEWAKQHAPRNRNECGGDNDFIRGCWKQLQTRIEMQRNEGIAWAKANQPVKAIQCQGAPHFVMGCREYFEDHLKKPRPTGLDRYEGMTTAECVEDVQGSIDALRAVDLEDGDMHKFEVGMQKYWQPTLLDCQNYDKTAAMKFMPLAYGRVASAMEKIKSGKTVSDDENAVILKDFAAMSRIPSQPYTETYMKIFEEYNKRRSGEFQESAIIYPQISCDDYQAKIDAIRKLDKQRGDAMIALKRADGTVINSIKYGELNKERIAILNDWALYNDGAKRNHCAITEK